MTDPTTKPGAPQLAEVERFLRAHGRTAIQGLSLKDNLRTCVKSFTVTAPSPVWHVIGTTDAETGRAIEPAFLNSWTNYDVNGFNSAAFRIDYEGRVYFRGLIKSGTLNTPGFLLPLGYRPARRCAFVSISNNAIGRLDVNTDGNVTIAQDSIGSNVWFSLEGISFDAGWTCAAASTWTTGGFPVMFETGFGHPPAGVAVWKVRDDTSSVSRGTDPLTNTPPPSGISGFGPVQVIYTDAGGGRVNIKGFTGLSPGRVYQVTLLFYAG